MNQKYFVISFILLVFFFLIHIEKTHGSRFKCRGCKDEKRSVYDAKLTAAQSDKLLTKRQGMYGFKRPKSEGCGAKITAASWTMLTTKERQPLGAIGGYLNMTITTPGGDPEYIGAVSFSDDNGHKYHILHDPWPISRPQKTFFWHYLAQETPINVWADVWALILWNCDKNKCASEFVHLRTWAPPQ
ncbi:2311_t:CDS:2 [Cetraspora pellucida]|uniref:2311_t:CDS:1 n=1 Tax=Cetraspora pellucida TaxID=1433469 RepID=A0ACA9M103_9GLOM|nr:2311_t:CDS:2 [Cetraspora pellucida]